VITMWCTTATPPMEALNIARLELAKPSAF
jgi:hypothetical protein